MDTKAKTERARC